MVSYEGDVLRPPGFSAPEVVPGSEELLFGYNPAPTKLGGTVKAGAGVLLVGTPIKFDAATKTYVKATEADAEALNYKATDATKQDRLINPIFGGIVKTNVEGIRDLDADALAATLGGTHNANLGYIKF